MSIHGTMGKQPLGVFESEEQRELLTLPPRPYDPVVWKKATQGIERRSAREIVATQSVAVGALMNALKGDALVSLLV